ncbi:hypothetical protein [Alkaliphilus sp. B6464]|uniref:hypothetical protein n=1 Tax=Alkaliphilus sp. B6464 TaxID=2731219 RepID=UPI001BA8E274|nr:hypothetical protein [Alkaliphilus sp. B6464]QUH22071.1 hypothetical protein HYG84_19385 [Alkaliphilus sp. B6464]
MDLKVEPMIILLYNIFKKYDSFLEVIWEHHKQKNVDSYYEFYESEIFGEESNKMKKKTKIYIINACLYIDKKIIPVIIKEKDINALYINTKVKINKYKTRLREQVESYLSTENDKKYILKELLDAPSDVNRQDFIQVRKNKINKWESDINCLLSDFYYLDELRKNQLNIIFVDEAIHLLLKDIYEEDNISLLNLLTSLSENKKKNKKSEKKGATVPNSMLNYDGLFGAGRKKIEDVKYEEIDGQIYATPNQNNENIQIRLPNLKVKDENINIEFDYKQDNITFNADDFKVLTAIFEIGAEILASGNEAVCFTMEEMCEHLQLEPCSKNYNKIARSIFYFKTKEVYIKISDTHIRIFNIIKTIDKPIFNSDRKKQWTIRFHEELVKEIVASKYKRILTKTISSYRYELSVLLFRVFVYDFYNVSDDIMYIQYSWQDLANKTGLNDKPSIIKRRIISALNEMTSLENSIISKYETAPDNSYFYIYPKRDNIKKLSDK